MSSISAPFGFRPAYSPNGIIRPSEFPDAIAQSFGTQIFIGQPVKLVAGFFQPITATTDQVYGVFAGVEWFANLNSTVKSGSTGWAAAGTYVPGSMRVWVHTDIQVIYEVQSTGSCAQTLLGNQMVTTNITAGNVNVGQSGATLGTASVGAAVQGQWIVTGVNQGPDNGWADNFTILQVRNAFPQGQPFVTSLG